MKDQYLRGKVAIVTGASRPNSIGAATAYALAEHGADVSDTTVRVKCKTGVTVELLIRFSRKDSYPLRLACRLGQTSALRDSEIWRPRRCYSS